MSLELGIKPEPLHVHLTTGADFDAVLEYDAPDGSDWPAGTTITLEFDGGATVWTASISGKDATFSEDRTAADLIPARTSALIRYVNGATEHIWYKGSAVRHG